MKKKLVELVDVAKEKKVKMDEKAFVRRVKKTTTNESFVPISMIAEDGSLSAATILYDADVYSVLNPTIASILKDETLISSVTSFLDLVDKSIDIVNNIKNIIKLLKEHKIEDYKIAAVTVTKAKMLDLSKLDFIKQYIIEPYLNNNKAETLINDDESSIYYSAKKSDIIQDDLSTDKEPISSLLGKSKNDTKDDRKKMEDTVSSSNVIYVLPTSEDQITKPEEKEAPVEKVGAEKLTKSEKRKLKRQEMAEKQRQKKENKIKTTAADISEKFTEEADVARTGSVTPADLVKNINNKNNGNCNSNTVVNHGAIPKAVVVPIHPELDIDGKAELLKKHIEFNGKNKNLTLEQVDNLLRMLEGPYLKQKLRELKSVCNPEYPIMKQVDSDNSSYDFKFITESQSGINIVVRMNSHTNEYNGIYISIGYEQSK